MQMVQRNPQMLTSLTGFARHWHDVGAKTEERTEETRELMQVMSHGYCIASALQRLGQGVDGYVVAVEQGGSGIERAAQSEQSWCEACCSEGTEGSESGCPCRIAERWRVSVSSSRQKR